MNALPAHAPTPKQVVQKVPDAWESIATVIQHLQASGRKTLLTVAGGNFTPIWIDFNSNRFFHAKKLTNLPEFPVDLSVFTQQIGQSAPLWLDVAWQSTNSLFWTIGNLAFTKAGARWLVPGDGYTLSSWPNLANINQTVGELKVISMLANALISIEQLAQASGSTVLLSSQVVSKLSLLQVIKIGEAPGSLSPPAQPAVRPPAQPTTPEVKLNPAPPASPLPAPVVPAKAQPDEMPELDETPPSAPIDENPVEETPKEPDQLATEEAQEVAHLYPAFDLNAPPPPIRARSKEPADPTLKIVDSFGSLFGSKPEDQ